MSHQRFSRRDVLRTAALLPLVGGFPALAALGAQATPQIATAPKRTLRFAHLTDSHLQPERSGAEGLAACLAHVQSQQDPPAFILTGGDNVMDVFEQKDGRARALAELFKKSWADHCSLPVEHTIGNHDIYGWNRTSSGTSGTESDWGKRFALQLFGLAAPYRFFDRGGWRFIVLDSVQPKDSGYVAFCDDAQLDWLKRTLNETPKSTPVCVISHIPILSLAAITYGKPRALDQRGKDTVVAASSQHTDGDSLHLLFKEHGGVKLCLSGHQHLLDRCETDGIVYICDGAVSGAWWKGSVQGVREGYGLIDLYDDGSFNHRYVPYGWVAKA
ncbi:MAG: metallophosphoesterase [Phycisphaerae bacterium]|nr:metallophosphoesterase [Phycisphaerae bacterium]